MDVESQPEVVAVDWRGRPCLAHRHGGMRAAVFVLGTRFLVAHFVACRAAVRGRPS
jgi:hypothetical protein